MTTPNIPPRWYVVDTNGMATFCAGEADARAIAKESDFIWPNNAPHVAIQLATVQPAMPADAERLDWLDSLNARLNRHYGTTYQWDLVLSPNVIRLMAGPGGNGHMADIDLHDSAPKPQGAPSIREAIDHARRRIEGE